MNSKRVISGLASMLILALCIPSLHAQRVKGSDSVLPLAQKEAENYLKKHPGSSVSVTGGGSGVGISALFEGTTDIAMSSRKMKFDEKLKFNEAKKAPVEKVIAYDALAVIVHPKNKVSQLTRQQLEDIFTGKIRNWKEVGGADLPIVAYSRETSSGTYEFFKEKVLKNKNYVNSVLSMPATGAIIQSVAQTPGAIGYIGLAYLNKEVKPIAVASESTSFVLPSIANAMNKSYPIVRPLLLYYLKGDEKKVASFIDYILSPEGQKMVQEVGYIPIQK